jgi:phosphomannomutase/phosphoglucomutase
VLLNQAIFREYDIRGVVGKDFDTDLAYALGVVFAKRVIETSGKKVITIGVGRDCRLTGLEMQESLVAGLRAGGASVITSGVGPTPQLYFTAVTKNLDAGIQVTASHNPGDQNGFKMMIGKSTLSGAAITALKEEILKIGDKRFPINESTTVQEFDARIAYTKELIERSKPYLGARKLKIVVDGGNGVGGLVGPAVLKALGCEVIELFTEPDGTFPNHHPDPTVVENLRYLIAKVKEVKADVGIAWDGDADRIGIVDENGTPIFGDMLLVIYGRQLLKEVKNPTIIGDVKCSDLLFSDLSSKGANAVMAKTGHSLIKAKIKELHAELAGEMSGHMFFAHRYYGFDDAIHASARLVEILTSTDMPCSQILADLPKRVSTPELRVDCPDAIKFEIVEKAKQAFPEYESNDLDGIRISFDQGWGLVRASNTQAALVMRFEASSEELLKEYRNVVEKRLANLRETLQA